MGRRTPLRLRFLLVAAAVSFAFGAVAGCRSAPEATDTAAEEAPPTEDQLTIRRLQAELDRATAELRAGARESAELRASAAELTETVAALQDEITRLRTQLERTADAQDAEVSSLRAEREALLRDLERVSTAAEIAAAQAAARTTSAASGGSTTADSRALADALRGLGGFRPVSQFGFRTDTRLSTRLGVTGTGLAVDSSREPHVLFDTSLDYTRPLVFLTVADPAGREPLLLLTVQYVSDVQPLYAQTAFIAVEPRDPVDPADPIVFTGSPARDTDGARLREAFTREVDRALLNRLSTMLSTGSVTGTFVGTTGQQTNQLTPEEREAMSRVLFAYIDLRAL